MTWAWIASPCCRGPGVTIETAAASSDRLPGVRCLRPQAGVTLIEVLVSFLILAGGLLALLGYQTSSQRGLADAKTQAEASALVEQKLQELQGYLDINDSRLVNGSYTATVNGEAATFDLLWEITDLGGGLPIKVFEVSASWTDRDGIDREVLVVSEVTHRRPTLPITDLMEIVQHARN